MKLGHALITSYALYDCKEPALQIAARVQQTVESSLPNIKNVSTSAAAAPTPATADSDSDANQTAFNLLVQFNKRVTLPARHAALLKKVTAVLQASDSAKIQFQPFKDCEVAMTKNDEKALLATWAGFGNAASPPPTPTSCAGNGPWEGFIFTVSVLAKNQNMFYGLTFTDGDTDGWVKHGPPKPLTFMCQDLEQAMRQRLDVQDAAVLCSDQHDMLNFMVFIKTAAPPTMTKWKELVAWVQQHHLPHNNNWGAQILNASGFQGEGDSKNRLVFKDRGTRIDWPRVKNICIPHYLLCGFQYDAKPAHRTALQAALTAQEVLLCLPASSENAPDNNLLMSGLEQEMQQLQSNIQYTAHKINELAAITVVAVPPSESTAIIVKNTSVADCVSKITELQEQLRALQRQLKMI